MLVFSFSGEPQSLSRQIRVRAMRRGEKPRQGQTWAGGGGEEKTGTVTQIQTKQPGLREQTENEWTQTFYLVFVMGFYKTVALELIQVFAHP